jgi:hypothetical protein
MNTMNMLDGELQKVVDALVLVFQLDSKFLTFTKLYGIFFVHKCRQFYIFTLHSVMS